MFLRQNMSHSARHRRMALLSALLLALPVVAISAGGGGTLDVSWQTIDGGGGRLQGGGYVADMTVGQADAGSLAGGLYAVSGGFWTFEPPVPAPPCPPDLDGSGTVDALDLAQLLGSWGPCPGCPADLDGDGIVGAIDLAQMLGAWGVCGGGGGE